VGDGAVLDPARKILDLEHARRWRKAARGTVVFTNGVFDVLHRGHVSLLARARAEGDHLLVGVNSDASARGLGKGKGRPVNGERDRAIVVAALESVDVVVVFGEDTPLALVEALQPDVLAKGAEYNVEDIVGADTVVQRGGRVVRVPLEPGFSTTDFLKKVTGGQA